MRGLLIVNPNATSTTENVRDVLVAALSHVGHLEVVMTTHKGHARELGEKALRDAVDVVVTLGGDGTINETVNGLLVDGPGPAVPALATVPGGSANVLARATGLPRDPVEATGVLIAGLHDERFRTISLGRANDHWFTTSVGMGLDAEIILSMERQRARGRRATPSRYLVTTLREYFAGTDRRNPAITLTSPADEPVDHVFVCIVQNAAPFTFFGDFPVNPSPEADFDRHLDVFAVRDLRVLPSLRWTRRMLIGSTAGPAKGLYLGRDVAELTMRSVRSIAVQIDGEAIQDLTEVRVVSVPGAIRIVV